MTSRHLEFILAWCKLARARRNTSNVNFSNLSILIFLLLILLFFSRKFFLTFHAPAHTHAHSKLKEYLNDFIGVKRKKKLFFFPIDRTNEIIVKKDFSFLFLFGGMEGRDKGGREREREKFFFVK